MAAFCRKKYKLLPFTGRFADSFGQPERGSRWLIYGPSGSGKTEFAVQLSKYFTNFGKVLYVSREQGDSSSLQLCFKRNKLERNTRIALGVDYDVTTLCAELDKTRNAYEFIIIDSLDYLLMTAEDYKHLNERYPAKTFVFISWMQGSRPKSAYARAIEYMVDVKITTKNYVAEPRCRYGGNEDFIIWDKAQRYSKILNQTQTDISNFNTGDTDD